MAAALSSLAMKKQDLVPRLQKLMFLATEAPENNKLECFFLSVKTSERCSTKEGSQIFD
jgi:hypothetical protein